MPLAFSRISSDEMNLLRQPVKTGTPEQIQSRYLELATKLQLNPKGKLLSTSEKTSLGILIPAVDDPDQGMDQDLPTTFDPTNERKFMGGLTGPTSQGFRHMYFGGWKVFHPIATFQVPFHAMGQAPERTRLFARQAREMIKSGDYAWGIRVIGWAMHYVQDLAQPFHAVQIPNLRMVPFSHLFTDLVPETTRVISNYHWVFEGYALSQIRSPESSTLKECVGQDANSALHWNPHDKNADPGELAREVAAQSLKVASEMGSALVAFTQAAEIDLKDPKVDLAHHIGVVDYRELAHRPGLQLERDRLEKVTCLAIRNGLDGSAKLIQWALQP